MSRPVQDDSAIAVLLLLVTALCGLNVSAVKTIAAHFHPAVMAIEGGVVAAIVLGGVTGSPCWCAAG